VTLAVVVAPAHALVLTVSHDSPIANPFIVAACRRRASPKQVDALPHEQHAIVAPWPVQAGVKYGAFAAMSDSVS
jgi:hypothetical protein